MVEPTEGEAMVEGRVDNSRGPTDGSGAGVGGARDGDSEPMSQGNREDLESQGRADDGSCNRGGDGIQKATVEPKQQRTKVKPEGWTQPEKWSLKAVDGRRLTKVELEPEG